MTRFLSLIVQVGLVLVVLFSNSVQAQQQAYTSSHGSCTSVAGCVATEVTWRLTNAAPGFYVDCYQNPNASSTGPALSQGIWRITARVECERASSGTLSQHQNDFIWPEVDVPAECDQSPNPPECPEACDGSITGDDIWRPGNGIGGGAICMENTGCVANIVNKTEIGSSDLVLYVGTANGCTSQPDVQAETSFDPQCIAEGGDTWCSSDNQTGENCGELNGAYICLETVPDGACTFFGNGDMACSSNAGTPPGPDNGTPGQGATPDGSIGSGDGTTQSTINTFSSTTVGGSSGGTQGSNQGDAPAPTEVTVELDFSDIIETANEPTSAQDIDTQTATSEGEVDAVIAELGDPSDFASPTVSGGTTIEGALSYGSCADVSIGGGAFPVVTLSCSDTADLRAVLGWILRIVLAMFAFNLVMTKPT